MKATSTSASTALAAILLVANAAPAAAWGKDGHQAVAALAARTLTARARQAVEDLLGPDAEAQLVAVSTWADYIRFQRPDTAPLHFVDIPITATRYEPERDCPSPPAGRRDQLARCVVAAIDRNAAIVRDTALAAPVRAEALKFLVHFVGDVHQPLHCADNSDRGGNLVQVRGVAGQGREKNLHGIWDVTVVTAVERQAGVDSGEQLGLQLTASPAELREWSRGSAADWAWESHVVAVNAIYAGLPGRGPADAPVLLPADYADRAAPIARQQLTRAGVRLGALLNSLLGR